MPYIHFLMITHTQDTHTQDPIDRFTLRIEEMRRDSHARGPARLVQNLVLGFFMSFMRLLADFAERRRNGTLPEVVPAAAPAQARAWPADLRPRESGWVERDLWDPWGNSTTNGPVEQPETIEPIAEVPGEMPPPRRARVRILKESSEPASARAQHVDDGCWPPWRKPGLVWTTEAGLWRLFSKKRVFAGVDTCARFVAV
jgi:hypothetical protein